MTNKLHRLRFWAAFDLLSSLFCWDVVATDASAARVVSLLKRCAPRCNTLQHTATHCNTLHATHCNALQRTATHCNTL